MRLIDADALKKAIINHLCVKSENNLLPAEKSIYNCIDEQPTIEQLKEQQPKLLTLKETINANYPMDVFCEIKGEERIFAVTAPVPTQWIGKPDIRYWTARPTEEQRKAEPWKDGERE